MANTSELRFGDIHYIVYVIRCIIQDSALGKTF